MKSIMNEFYQSKKLIRSGMLRYANLFMSVSVEMLYSSQKYAQLVYSVHQASVQACKV